MKKVVLSLAIVAAMFVSCKEAATETPAVDSTAVETPVEEVAPVADSTAVVADSAAVEAPAATEAPATK